MNNRNIETSSLNRVRDAGGDITHPYLRLACESFPVLCENGPINKVYIVLSNETI